MYRVSMTLIFGVVVGFGQRCRSARMVEMAEAAALPRETPAEPPSATFQEWVAAIVAEEETCRNDKAKQKA